MTLTAVSLFAGIEGFGLAMQREGIDVVAAMEIDKHARGVIEYHFPETKLFNDIKDVSGEQLRDAGFVPERGIITGGFPCQDLSIAGKRAGLAGGRSGLFWEIVRLADELKPQYLVLENVPGLLSSNGGRDFGAVLGALVELGFGVSWSILDSQYWGVAQRRRRVFIVGCLGDDGRTPAQILALPESLRGDFETGDETGEESATDVGGGVANTLGTKRRHDLDNETYVPVLLTMREGKDGGGKGPLISEDVSLTLATGNGQVLIQPQLARTLTARHDSSPDGDRGFNIVVQPYVKVVRSGARDENGDLPPEVWAERELAPTLNVMDNTGDSRATVLTLYKVNNHLGRESNDVASTLSAQMGTGGHNVPVLASQSTVRRLTPVECERLQGFEDDWTKYRVQDGKVVEQADSSRYKQLGNAVTVSVVQWIMGRLVQHEQRRDK